MALLVGLTGGMGSGKSTVASMLAKCGANVIDADQICRQLVEPDKPAWKEIVDTFGPDILSPDRTLDRQRLANRVFKDLAAKASLESILHPRVFVEERRTFDAIKALEPDAVVVLDAALLIESGNYRNVDKVVVVSCPEEEQVRRVSGSGKFSVNETKERLRSQMPLTKKLKHADYVIPNESTLDSLESQVGLAHLAPEAGVH
ncbi:MAG: dephospho-CoA kinase, partial [Nitrospinaceae bacterium]